MSEALMEQKMSETQNFLGMAEAAPTDFMENVKWVQDNYPSFYKKEDQN